MNKLREGMKEGGRMMNAYSECDSRLITWVITVRVHYRYSAVVIDTDVRIHITRQRSTDLQ